MLIPYLVSFENVELKNFCRQKVTSERRKLHNEELHCLCSFLGIIRGCHITEVQQYIAFSKLRAIFRKKCKGKLLHFIWRGGGADRRLLLKTVLNARFNNMEWIKPANHRDQRRDIVCLYGP